MINKSTEIGPWIISKYSAGKYFSNADDGFDDPLESTELLKINDESNVVACEEFQSNLRTNRVKRSKLDDVMSIPRQINWEKELENDKLKYATIRNQKEDSVSPVEFKPHSKFYIEKP